MSKNSIKNISSRKVYNFEDVNRELDNLRQVIRDLPLIFGDGTPENSVYASLGWLYTDNKNGKLYKKATNDKENNGWIEIT